MEPQTVNATAGEDVSIVITVTDSAGAAVDITAATPRFALSRRPAGAVVASTEESPATITAALTTPLSGIFTVTIPDTTTTNLLGTYYWQAEIEDASGLYTTVAHGFLTIRPALV